MYTIFIPKYENETPDFLITKTLELFMNSISCDCIISSPGYMSTTSNTIRQYIQNLSDTVSKNCCPYLGFFNGMNGNNPVRYGANTIRQEHENEVSISSSFQSLPIQCNNHRDHRKMMFFIKNKSMPQVLDSRSIGYFLRHSTVCGILVGSSNQSLNTYYGGAKRNPADKGEADILMYYDDGNNFTERIIAWKSDYPNIRISQSIDIKEGISEREYESEYFKEILKNFIENNLTR